VVGFHNLIIVLVIASINVHDFHMIIHVKNIYHINMHVESHEEPCNVQILQKFLLNFLLISI